jgi:hypothetical protein
MLDINRLTLAVSQHHDWNSLAAIRPTIEIVFVPQRPAVQRYNHVALPQTAAIKRRAGTDVHDRQPLAIRPVEANVRLSIAVLLIPTPIALPVVALPFAVAVLTLLSIPLLLVVPLLIVLLLTVSLLTIPLLAVPLLVIPLAVIGPIHSGLLLPLRRLIRRSLLCLVLQLLVRFPLLIDRVLRARPILGVC